MGVEQRGYQKCKFLPYLLFLVVGCNSALILRHLLQDSLPTSTFPQSKYRKFKFDPACVCAHVHQGLGWCDSSSASSAINACACVGHNILLIEVLKTAKPVGLQSLSRPQQPMCCRNLHCSCAISLTEHRQQPMTARRQLRQQAASPIIYRRSTSGRNSLRREYCGGPINECSECSLHFTCATDGRHCMGQQFLSVAVVPCTPCDCNR